MKQNKLTKLSYNDIKIGMNVKDIHGDIGVVIECDDIHNILVDCGNGDIGLYCLLEGCEDGTGTDILFAV